MLNSKEKHRADHRVYKISMLQQKKKCIMGIIIIIINNCEDPEDDHPVRMQHIVRD